MNPLSISGSKSGFREPRSPSSIADCWLAICLSIDSIDGLTPTPFSAGKSIIGAVNVGTLTTIDATCDWIRSLYGSSAFFTSAS